jgi:hypothetical protein
MAKEKKKPAKESSELFHNIMKQSVQVKPKLEKFEKYFYPSKKNPAFTVETIEDGYMFTIYRNEGEANTFSINKKIVENKHAATGYEGYEGMAIEIFRRHF